jgi:hypothetical protein
MMTSTQQRSQLTTKVCGANRELGGRMVRDKVKSPTIRFHKYQHAVQQVRVYRQENDTSKQSASPMVGQGYIVNAGLQFAAWVQLWTHWKDDWSPKKSLNLIRTNHLCFKASRGPLCSTSLLFSKYASKSCHVTKMIKHLCVCVSNMSNHSGTKSKLRVMESQTRKSVDTFQSWQNRSLLGLRNLLLDARSMSFNFWLFGLKNVIVIYCCYPSSGERSGGFRSQSYRKKVM